jgi:hypothetical protein
VGNGAVLDIMAHKNIRLSNIIVSDIVDSDHLPIIFHILDHVRTKNVLAPLEKIRLGAVSKPSLNPESKLTRG